MNSLNIGSLALASLVTSVAIADYQTIQIEATASGTLNATGCCSMAYMGTANPTNISMKTCQSVYMSCIGSRRAGVWLFDLTSLPDDATLVSARFEGVRTYSDMNGSGFIALEFGHSSLNTDVCMSLWNGGDWLYWMEWPWTGTPFSITITPGLSSQFATATSVALMGYASSTYGVTVVNSGSQKPVLEVTVDVPDTPQCDGDMNEDGVVDGVDVSLVLGWWGRSHQGYDADGSGSVDGADLAYVLGNWGPCPE